MNFLQLTVGLIIGTTSGISFYMRSSEEGKLQTDGIKPGRKTCIVEPLILPFVLVIALIMPIISGGGSKYSAILAKSVVLTMAISVYHAAILILLPLLRRIISARACAVLWMAPAFLYLTLYTTGYEASPLLVITLPRQWLDVCAWIWATGFVSVVIWQAASNIGYRKSIMKNCEEVADASVLSLWHKESTRHGVKRRIPIFVSQAVSTPLTIGCFDRTMRLILPGDSFTNEELEIIFRHELRHIVRADTRTKLFIGLCAAISWFNPLGWVARRKVADDLELSCDEAVLSGADETTRRLYAELLLKNAGHCRGYTTCLSAAASSLRYRLNKIVNPAKRLKGGAVIGIAMFGLVMSLGTVALADSADTLQALVFSKSPAGLVVDSVSTNYWNTAFPGYRVVNEPDDEALSEYLASLLVKRAYVGTYHLEVGSRQLEVEFSDAAEGHGSGTLRVVLCDGLLFVYHPYDKNGDATFIIEDEIDWDYIESIL